MTETPDLDRLESLIARLEAAAEKLASAAKIIDRHDSHERLRRMTGQ